MARLLTGATGGCGLALENLIGIDEALDFEAVLTNI
jgi:hypothetical protein